MKQHYKTIIYGATFYGCGLAWQREDTLIIEPGVVPGWEFSLVLNPGRSYNNPPTHPEALAFWQDGKRRHAFTDSCAYPGAFTPLLSKWCLEHNIEMSLDTIITKQQQSNEVSGLTCVNVAGEQQISADNFIDARPPRQGERRLFAALRAKSADTPALPSDSIGLFTCFPGCFPDTSYAAISIPESLDWPDARSYFLENWKKREAQLSDWTLVALGVRFNYEHFNNPLAALQAGLQRETGKQK